MVTLLTGLSFDLITLPRGSREFADIHSAMTTFYIPVLMSGNILQNLDVCYRAACSEMQSVNYRCEKS